MSEWMGWGLDLNERLTPAFETTNRPQHTRPTTATEQKNGKRFATPLFMCLLCIELSDFVFAVDSIPAVLGVSKARE